MIILRMERKSLKSIREIEVIYMLWRGKDKNKQAVERPLIAELDPRSPITEQYRTVRTNIQFASIDQELRTIMVTSASPEEGKSMTAANLATVYAHQEKKVLLIDADLRKATVHMTFQLDNFRGLSKWLVGGSALQKNIQKSRTKNLVVITPGRFLQTHRNCSGHGK